VLQNAQGVGQSAAIMAEYDRLDVFFLNIAPHGQLELYCIFVAAAAGLMIFWAWVAPGSRTRLQALAEDGRALFAVIGGLVVGRAATRDGETGDLDPISRGARVVVAD